jgi:glucose-6-phosphate 1-dehydrogenase
MILHVNNDRWKGVPFIMKAGKGKSLPEFTDTVADSQH